LLKLKKQYYCVGLSDRKALRNRNIVRISLRAQTPETAIFCGYI
jgi:hypothetical protein